MFCVLTGLGALLIMQEHSFSGYASDNYVMVKRVNFEKKPNVFRFFRKKNSLQNLKPYKPKNNLYYSEYRENGLSTNAMNGEIGSSNRFTSSRSVFAGNSHWGHSSGSEGGLTIYQTSSQSFHENTSVFEAFLSSNDTYKKTKSVHSPGATTGVYPGVIRSLFGFLSGARNSYHPIKNLADNRYEKSEHGFYTITADLSALPVTADETYRQRLESATPPPDDGTGPTPGTEIPVSDGVGFLLLLAVGYGFVRKKVFGSL